MNEIVYKICTRKEWSDAEDTGYFDGSAIDVADGFIHFSTADQVRETAAKHFADQADLVLVAVATEKLSGELKWEPSRGGDLFPHLYDKLPVNAAVQVSDLPLSSDGGHQFPDSIE